MCSLWERSCIDKGFPLSLFLFFMNKPHELEARFMWLARICCSLRTVCGTPCVCVCALVHARVCACAHLCVCVCLMGIFDAYFRKKGWRSTQKSLTEREQCRGSGEEAENEKKGFGGVAGLPPSNAASRQPGGNSIKDKSRILYFVSLMWGQSKRRTHPFEFPWPLYHKRPSFAWICGQKISLSSRHRGNKGGNRCLEVFPPFPQSLHRLTLTWQNPAAALCNGLPVYCCETSLCY